MQYKHDWKVFALTCALFVVGAGMADAAPSLQGIWAFPSLVQVSPNPNPNGRDQSKKPPQAPAKHMRADKVKALGKAFIGHMSRGAFGRARNMTSGKMKQVLTTEKMRGFWLMLQMRLGRFVKIEDISYKLFRRKFAFAIVQCAFQNKSIAFRLVFGPKDQIMGMQLVPAKKRKGTKKPKATPAPPVKMPSYVKRGSYKEQPVVVQAKGTRWKLKGTLTLPQAASPKAQVPAVVLVHGSGDHDQDETVGGNKVFRDLAWGLASQGVAVLRYTKRTKLLSQFLRKLPAKKRSAIANKVSSKIDLNFEVLDDARAAVALLAKTPGIDTKRIFIVGHSLGAMMAPSIAHNNKQVAGIVMMGSPSRTLHDVILDQIIYLSLRDQKLTPSEYENLRQTILDVAAIKAGLLSGKMPKGRRLGMTSLYLLSLQKNSPMRMIKKLKKPAFLLHGGRDYQVTDVDYKGWKPLLKGIKQVTMKRYPSLNHLFITGKGPSTPQEYLKPGHVAGQVIMDIAGWIKKAPALAAPASRPSTKAQVMSFLKSYLAGYKKGDVKAMMALYDQDKQTMSISSRGDRFIGVKAIEQMYQVTFKNVKFEQTKADTVLFHKVSNGLIVNAKFAFVSSLREQAGERYQVRSQGTFFLHKRGGKWVISHEHYSPILGIPRISPAK